MNKSCYFLQLHWQIVKLNIKCVVPKDAWNRFVARFVAALRIRAYFQPVLQFWFHLSFISVKLHRCYFFFNWYILDKLHKEIIIRLEICCVDDNSSRIQLGICFAIKSLKVASLSLRSRSTASLAKICISCYQSLMPINKPKI